MQAQARTLLKYFPSGTGCYEGLYGPNFIVYCIGAQRVGKLTRYNDDLYHVTAYSREYLGSLADIDKRLAADKELKGVRQKIFYEKMEKTIEVSKRVSDLCKKMIFFYSKWRLLTSLFT